jgi:hypothetical protein
MYKFKIIYKYIKNSIKGISTKKINANPSDEEFHPSTKFDDANCYGEHTTRIYRD